MLLFIFYFSLYFEKLNSKEVKMDTATVEKLKECLAQFMLEKVQEVFASWSSANLEMDTTMTENDSEFIHDGKKFVAKVIFGDTYFSASIPMHRDTFSVSNMDIKDIQFIKKDYEKDLSEVIKFAHNFLNSEKIKVKVYFSERGLEFKSINDKSKAVNFLFHFGLPIPDDWDEFEIEQ